MSPSSPSFATISYGKAFVRSGSPPTGAISPSANSRTVRRISSWSGGRSKSIRPSKQRADAGGSAPGGLASRQLEQQSDAPPRGALVDVRPPEIVGDARDVQMRPRDLAGEAVEERRGGDRQRLATLRDVGDIGVAPLDHLVVERVERQPPDALPGRLTRRRDRLAPAVVAAHQAGVDRSERGDDPAR